MQEILTALCDPTRRAALALVWDGGEHCVCELMAHLGASQSRMSRHMKALREAGLLSALGGSHRRARKYLDESLDVAEQQGARSEHAQTLLARGRVGLMLDWPSANEEVAVAREALDAMGADFALEHVAGTL